MEGARNVGCRAGGEQARALHQADAGFDDGDGGGEGGLGAEDARAEVGEGEVICAEQVAFGGGPTALRTDRERDKRGSCEVGSVVT